MVAETLMGRVLDGTYGPGARLPSERDLATELGVARVSVRQALGVLGGWRVVSTLRGSGATVAPERDWTSDVLPAALTYALLSGGWKKLARLVTDALEVRRSLVLSMFERSAAHLGPDMLDGARRALDKACAAPDRGAFLAADRDVIPHVLEAAGMLPSVWLLNSLAAPYLLVMARFGEQAKQDPKYREAHLETFAALEARDGEAARARFSRHLDVADRLIVDALPDDLRSELVPKKRRSR
jgi:DNA-binding FadR family transcriptional regulator